MLLIALPLLLRFLFQAKDGSRRAGVLLTGMLAVFLYNAASTVFGVAFNPLFPLYVIYFSVSLYAFALALSSQGRSTPLPDPLRKTVTVFLFLSGLSTAVWLVEIVPALLENRAPDTLAHYTTEVTAILDWGIVAPACFIAGLSVLRRRPLGAMLAPVLLDLMTMVGIIVSGQRIMQALVNASVSSTETAVYVLPFLILSAAAAWLLRRSLAAIPSS